MLLPGAGPGAPATFCPRPCPAALQPHSPTWLTLLPLSCCPGAATLLCQHHSEYLPCELFSLFVLTQEPQTTVIHNPDGNKVRGKMTAPRSDDDTSHPISRVHSVARHRKENPYPLPTTLSFGPNYLALYPHSLKTKKNDILKEMNGAIASQRLRTSVSR